MKAVGTPTATTVVPAKHEAGDQAAASVVKANVTAAEPTYAAVNVDEYGNQGLPSLSGYHFEPVLEARPLLAVNTDYGLRLMVAVTSFDADIEVTFREVG